MRTRYTILILLGTCFGVTAWALDAPSLKTLDHYSRLIVPVNNGANFRMLSEGAGSVKLELTRTSTSNLQNLSSLQDSRVAKLLVTSSGLDSAQLEINFRSNSESFAYLQPSPPAVVIDLWTKTSDPQKVQEKIKKVAKAPVKKISPKTREIASVKPEQQVPRATPLSASEDIFPKFILPMPPLTFSEGRIAYPPRTDIENMWEIPRPKLNLGDGGNEVGFAQKLYKEGKFGLCIRTLEIMQRDYPKNPYTNEIQSLYAFAYKRLGDAKKTPSLVAKADSIFHELEAKTDSHGHFLPFHQSIKIYFANKAYASKQWFDAIDKYEALASGMDPNEKEYPYLQMTLAGLYIYVEQPRRAERIYRFLEEHYPKHAMAKEANYRRVSLLAIEKNYDRVIEEGENAVHDYPEYQHTRSEVFFNMGEAHFWKKEYAAAGKSFRHFIDLSPSVTNVAEARVRLGEIAELSEHNLAKAREEYLSAKNDFPFSSGDRIATLRLARLDLNTEPDLRFQIHSLEKIRGDALSDAPTKQIADLLLIDYLLKEKSIEDAISIAHAGMVNNAEGVAAEAYKKAYIEALFVQLQNYIAEQNYAKALQLYQDKKQWIDQHGAEVFRELAATYRGIGLFETSNKYIQQFLSARRGDNSRHIASEAIGERAIQIEKAKNALAQARYAETLSDLGSDELDGSALWIRASALHGLKKMPEAETYARKALAYFNQHKSNAKIDPDTKLMVEGVGDILVEHGESERDFNQILTDLDQVNRLLDQKVERFEYTKADAFWYLGRHKEAVAAYLSVISAYPKSDRVEHAQYNLGMSYSVLGKHDAAVKALTELKDKSQTVWGQSAKQELELMTWEKKYSSVLKSLPPSGLGITN